MNIRGLTVMLSAGLLAFAAPLASDAEQVADIYTFKMSLRVPRVYDNTTSLGYRKYQTQTIVGTMKIIYDAEDDSVSPMVDIVDLVNKTHKINGTKVTYNCYVEEDYEYAFLVGLGNNKTETFKYCGIDFSFVADPSYNIGGVL